MGLVVWQSAFVLAELLLRAPPFGQWDDVRTLDLGTGTGASRVQVEYRGFPQGLVQEDSVDEPDDSSTSVTIIAGMLNRCASCWRAVFKGARTQDEIPLESRL